MNHSKQPRGISVRKAADGGPRSIEIEYPEDIKIEEVKDVFESVFHSYLETVGRLVRMQWMLRASVVANLLMLAVFYWR